MNKPGTSTALLSGRVYISLVVILLSCGFLVCNDWLDWRCGWLNSIGYSWTITAQTSSRSGWQGSSFLSS